MLDLDLPWLPEPDHDATFLVCEILFDSKDRCIGIDPRDTARKADIHSIAIEPRIIAFERDTQLIVADRQYPDLIAGLTIAITLERAGHLFGPNGFALLGACGACDDEKKC